jgi:hypothetical protein
MKPMNVAGLFMLALSLALGASAQVARANQSALNGRYRVTITDADLRASGVLNPAAIRENHGVFTWLLRDGRWQFHQEARNLHTPSNLRGRYTVDRDRVTFVFRVPGAPQGAPPPLTFRWKLERGQLRFTLVRGKDPYKIVPTLITAHPWRRIG